MLSGKQLLVTGSVSCFDKLESCHYNNNNNVILIFDAFLNFDIIRQKGTVCAVPNE